MSGVSRPLHLYPDGCIRTGFSGYLKQHGLFIHGDLFRYDQTVIARISSTTHATVMDPIHAVFREYYQWFDRDAQFSTLVANLNQVKLFSYKGERPDANVLNGFVIGD